MKRVLIVDDSALIVEQLTDVLVSLGYAVAGSASSGTQAVDQARQLRPDVILMDIVMPGQMDGIDAAGPIRDELDIPIIFMTAYEDEKSIDRVKEARAHGYLLKPIRALDLKASIEIALQKRESEARFRDLYREVVEKTSDLVYALDGQGNVRFANDQITRMGGYTREEVIGKNFSSFLTPDSVKYAIEIFRRRLRGEDVGPFELELLDSSGNRNVIEMRERMVWKDGMVVEIHGIGRDVTERKRAEEALRKSKERYRIITDNMTETLWVLDKNFKPVYVSPSVERARGYSFEEIALMPLEKNLTPESFRKTVETVVDMLTLSKIGAGEPKEPRVLTLEWIRKDGTTYWTEVSLSLITDGQGNPIEILSVGRDITERRKAEEALRKSEERYRIITDNMQESVWVLDKEFKPVYVSPLAMRTRGYTFEEIQTLPLKENMTPESFDKIVKVIIDLLNKKKAGHTESQISEALDLEWIRKDGTHYWTEVCLTLIFDEGGELSEVLGVGRDITERRRAEEALRESEAKFRGVFETSRDFMYISSLDGKIIDYNPSAKGLFGYTDEEMGSMTMLDLYHDPEDRVRVMEKLMSEGFVENQELRLKKKDGSTMDMLANITVRKDGDDNIIGFQGAMKDITQMKRMEQYLLQTEKLSGLGTMISGVAHELNNPLTGIMASAELLLMDRNMSDKARKILKTTLRESERAAAIIGGLLSFAREHKPGRKLVSINEIIIEAYRLRQYNLKISNIAVNLSLSKDLPPTSADPHQLHQVFTNIINNAHDALTEKRGGTLTITSTKENGSLIIAFEDDGPGIEEESLKKVFDPFFTTKDVGKGTGLGLSVAYGIIKEHGGNIEVESEKGKGAKFIVTIPISSQADEKDREIAEPEPEREAAYTGKRILVVDDEKHLRDTLCEALSRKGYIVEESASGQEALEKIERSVFDAVVADIKMPGMDGKELYGHVLNKYPDIAGRFLFITGDILGKETQVFLNVSTCRYIAKPFRMNEFLVLLNQVLRR